MSWREFGAVLIGAAVFYVVVDLAIRLRGKPRNREIGAGYRIAALGMSLMLGSLALIMLGGLGIVPFVQWTNLHHTLEEAFLFGGVGGGSAIVAVLLFVIGVAGRSPFKRDRERASGLSNNSLERTGTEHGSH